MLLTATLDVSPSSDPAVCSCVEHTASCCQTHRSDVVGEVHWRGQLQQADVIVEGLGVVVGISDDLGHCAGHLVGVQRLLGLTTKVNQQTRCAGAEKQEINRVEVQRRSDCSDLNSLVFIANAQWKVFSFHLEIAVSKEATATSCL